MVKGSALCALKGEQPEIGSKAILKLMEAVDSYIKVREVSGMYYHCYVSLVHARGHVCACVDMWKESLYMCMQVPERAVDKPFQMPIEDVFSIAGRGTVVTGRVEQGE